MELSLFHYSKALTSPKPPPVDTSGHHSWPALPGASYSPVQGGRSVLSPGRCRSLLISPQVPHLGPRPPPGVESGPTPTDQRLSLRHSRPPSADSSEGLIRAISQGWDVDGSLLLLGGLGKSLQLHSGPHLGSGQVLDTKSPPNGCCSYRSSSSPSKRKWRGSAQGPA